MKKKKITDASISLRELARRQGVSHVTVQAWVEAGLPTVDGKIDPTTGAAWVRKYRRAEKEAEKHGELSQAEAERRKAIALMRLREIEAAEAEGLVVSVEDAAARFAEAISVCRSRLLRIPSSAAPELARESDPTRVESILRKLVFDALSELAGQSLPTLEQ